MAGEGPARLGSGIRPRTPCRWPGGASGPGPARAAVAVAGHHSFLRMTSTAHASPAQPTTTVTASECVLAYAAKRPL